MPKTPATVICVHCFASDGALRVVKIAKPVSASGLIVEGDAPLQNSTIYEEKVTMKLRPANQRLELAGEDAVRILREIELVVISLHKIGSFYAVADESERRDYFQETTRFIDEWKVTARLAEARGVLSGRFDLTLGDDDMDDLERKMESVDYWSGPGCSPKAR